MFSQLIPFFAAHRKTVIRIFQLFYLVIFIAILFFWWALQSKSESLSTIYDLGKNAGSVAIVLFFVVTLPGILGRFRLKHPLITLGIMFRRHTGLSTFALSLFHASVLYIVPNLFFGSLLVFPLPNFLVFGMLAFLCFFLMALTSNDFSVKAMGKWWKRLHKLVYLIFWFIFLHVGLQGQRWQMISLGLVGTLEVVSLLFDWWKKKSVASSTVATPPTVKSQETI